MQQELDSAPTQVWHYTNTHGLIGILSTGTLWATDNSFLNDATELKYAHSKMQESLLHNLPAPDRSVLENFFSSPTPRNARTAVACFCADGDLLSQWRGYASPGGFAIAFDTSILMERWVNGGTGLFMGVNYEEEKAENSAKRWASQVEQAWREALGHDDIESGLSTFSREQDSERIEWLARSLFDFESSIGHLAWLAATYKHPSFSEEQEWRLVAGITSEMPTYRTRADRSGLVPYRIVSFQETPTESPIKEIRIGPGFDNDNQQIATERLLKSLGYGDVHVSFSQVPFRP